jgi:hypothetical protein
MQDLNKGMYKSIILQAYKQKENSPSWFGKEYLEHLLGVYTDIIHNESKMTWNVIDVDIIKLKHYFGVNEVSL